MSKFSIIVKSFRNKRNLPRANATLPARTVNKTSKNISGFMLFEVILSVAILSLGLVMVLHSFTGSLKAIRVSQNYMRATLLLEEKMSEMERKGTIPMGTDQGKFSAGNEEFSWEIESIPAEEISGKDKEEIELNEVRLTVSWLEGKRKKQVRVTTYLTKAEEKKIEG